MCGIVGIVDGRGRIDAEMVVRMRDRLIHRGPDSAGVWQAPDGRAVLGHRRLAIVDLSPAGAQPMTGTGGATISYNGEIYNHRELRAVLQQRGHRFAGSSDTEVLLAAYTEWGEDCLDHLVGMFAFAIWEPRSQTLFCARDRCGEKPLFYRVDGRRLAFASELKALLAEPGAPRRLCAAGLNEYLAYGYVPGDRCILQGYAKLAAGTALRFDTASGALTIRRYWSLPHHRAAAGDLADFTDEVAGLIERSVARQVVADVPVGVLLSGGLDSSLIAAAAVRAAATPVNTFTIGFPDSPAHDESAHAAAVAAYLGTRHTMLPADVVSRDDLPALVAQYDEPLADSSLIPTFLVSRLIRGQCTVALGGDGGDELFGGYRHYQWMNRLTRWKKVLPALDDTRTGRALPLATPGRGELLAIISRFAPELTITRLLDPVLRAALAAPGLLTDLDAPERHRAALVADRPTAFERSTALDAQVFMCDDILVKVDRASMLSSLEVRAPLLDHGIVEFAFGALPTRFRAHGNHRKIVLRSLAARWLLPDFDAVRKQGFKVPIDRWLRGPWAPLVAELRASASPLFDQPAIGRFIDRASGSERGANRIFQLLMLDAWRRHYDIEVG